MIVIVLFVLEYFHKEPMKIKNLFNTADDKIHGNDYEYNSKTKETDHDGSGISAPVDPNV